MVSTVGVSAPLVDGELVESDAAVVAVSDGVVEAADFVAALATPALSRPAVE